MHIDSLFMFETPKASTLRQANSVKFMYIIAQNYQFVFFSRRSVTNIWLALLIAQWISRAFGALNRSI